MRANLSIEVNDDGSADLSGFLAFDEAFIGSAASEFGEDVAVSGEDDICAQFAADNGAAPVGNELEYKPYRDGDFCGLQFDGSVAPDGVEEQLNSPGSQIAAELQRDGDGWTFALNIDDPLGAEAAGGGALFDSLDLFGSSEFVVRVKLPGEQVDHNANSIEGDGTMRWEVDLADLPVRLFARTQPGEPITGSGGPGEDGGGGDAGAVILIVVVALVGLGLAAFWLMRKSSPAVASPVPTRRQARAPSATSSAPAPIVDAVGVQPTKATSAAEPAGPRVIASPTPEQATGEPVWDPVRRGYVQWDPHESRWLTFDDDTQAWVRETGP